MAEYAAYLGSCQNGHVFIFAGSPDFEIPNGLPCSCGQYVARWTTCKECGQRKLEAVPKKEDI